jgi:hypothetical protein
MAEDAPELEAGQLAREGCAVGALEVGVLD